MDEVLFELFALGAVFGLLVAGLWGAGRLYARLLAHVREEHEKQMSAARAVHAEELAAIRARHEAGVADILGQFDR